MTPARPHVIYDNDIPDPPTNLVEDLIATVTTPSEPDTPKAMHRHLLDKAHKRAVVASENAYDACDWLALLDQTTADRYRKSARHLYELSEHLAVLIEES